MAIELCLFRHGRTTWNAAGRYQGQTDIDLDSLGRGQAIAVAERCGRMGALALYSSDLRRCRDVADKISDKTGLDVRPEELLRERDFGTWAGLTRNEIRQQYGDEFAAWQAGDSGLRPGGGETYEDIGLRVDGFLDRVREEQNEGVVIAMTHGGWIRTMLRRSLGSSYAPKLFGVPTQGSLTVFVLKDDGSAVLEAFNDRGHLLDVEPVDLEAPAEPVY